MKSCSLESSPALLGYLNFSTGKPDPRFQKQINDAFAHLASQDSIQTWQKLGAVLKSDLKILHESGTAAFRQIEQAQAVLDLVFDHVLQAYRQHHDLLLSHVSEDDLFQPFFLARVFEAVLAQRPPWNENSRIVAGALKQLNDYVGYRPIAVLETRRRGEPYEHERFRPVPLYLRGAGVAWGPFEPLIRQALDILTATDTDILAEACFEPERLDELALDVRGYDFDHPVDKRPNYSFGEWDPHHIDNDGNYRRFVVRQTILDGLWQRLESEKSAGRAELLFEASAVLACTILMAAAVSGAGPTTYDSSVNLGELIPRIAKFREAFYAALLPSIHGDHEARLRKETEITRQPFGGARQHLNRYLAGQRALQMQQRRLGLLLADIGYPAASRRQLQGVNVTSMRLLTEMHVLLSAGNMAIEQGNLALAAKKLPIVEDLLKKGISCGAVVDPWNILGFQGNFPRSVALEDSIRDPRIDPLVRVIERIFNLFARLLSEGAAGGSFAVDASLGKEMARLADWWDKFATTTVSDIPHIHGGEAAASAQHVARALSHWRERGQASADLAFWREHLDQFRSAKSFALVVDALLRKEDFRASMALLMTWLSQAEEVPLEEGDFSFHHLALRWMLGVCALASADPLPQTQQTPLALVSKFFDYLEANAEDYGQVPQLDTLGTGDEERPAQHEKTESDDDSLFSAAYENMTYKDTTDDDVEGEVLDFMPQKDFDLAHEAERLERRLKFLATMARLWNVATRALRDARESDHQASPDALRQWLDKARTNYQGLLKLLDAIHEHEIPKPSGSYDSLVEYDNRRVLKERLLSLVIATSLDQSLAMGALRGLEQAEETDPSEGATAPWAQLVIRLERALLKKQPAEARSWLPQFIEIFKQEPLLYTPLAHGGHPRQILRAVLAQTILRGLVANLPRQGLVRETYQLVVLSQTIEQGQTLSGPRVTEFDRLFQLALQAVSEALVEAAERDHVAPEKLVSELETVVEPFLKTWIEHSKTLRVSALEALASDKEWAKLGDFIKKYGHDLFHARFMTLANLRGILHRGVGPYLDYLVANPDPLHPIKLATDLENGLARQECERWLQIILQTIVENYDHFRDYNTTTTQSDYGENLHQLFEFLRLKASYERHAWQIRPLNLVHEALAKKNVPAAELWRRSVEELSKGAAEHHLHQLAKLERKHGMRLATITDRLEERFVRPMALDGLCALIEPAMAQAPALIDQDPAVPLEEALRPFAAGTTSAGLDVPQWILRLEAEVQRVRNSKSALVNLAETLFQVPKVPVPFAELAEQLRDWKKIPE